MSGAITFFSSTENYLREVQHFYLVEELYGVSGHSRAFKKDTHDNDLWSKNCKCSCSQ